MAVLTLYGSAVADTTLTTACKMASASGGVETSKDTACTAGTGAYMELYSQGNAGTTGVAAIPATPTGHGWVYSPGAGTFALGNWSASIAYATSNAYGNSDDFTVRFFRYSSGTYTSIGTITISGHLSSQTREVLSFSATSMATITFGTSDLAYVDFWVHDAAGVNGDTFTIYESTTATAGVANDMQITTSTFTASGGATHLRISDGYGGVYS